MSDQDAAALIRLLVLVGSAGAIGRYAMRSREPRAAVRTALSYAPYLYWAVILVILAHPLAVALPAWYGQLRFAGLALAMAGGAFAAWAALHMGRYWDVEISALADHRVVEDGPFAIVRHPIYLGLIAFFAGTTIALGDPIVAVASVGGGAVAVARARAEERFLAERLGESYRRYQRRVSMLLPLPRR